MRPQKIRLLTALAVVGICVWPVCQGVNVVRYATADSKPEALQPWFAVAGLAFDARERALTPTNDSSDDSTIRKRRDELAQILAIKPLSSHYWLQLAEVRVDAHEILTKAIDALELSDVTGPNEGYMMAQRGLFGIWQWEALPAEVQYRAIADLAARQNAHANRISDPEIAWLRKTLSEKTEKVRQAIRLDLQAQGFPESDFSLIGL
jgi:hypothetical protein